MTGSSKSTVNTTDVHRPKPVDAFAPHMVSTLLDENEAYFRQLYPSLVNPDLQSTLVLASYEIFAPTTAPKPIMVKKTVTSENGGQPYEVTVESDNLSDLAVFQTNQLNHNALVDAALKHQKEVDDINNKRKEQHRKFIDGQAAALRDYSQQFSSIKWKEIQEDPTFKANPTLLNAFAAARSVFQQDDRVGMNFTMFLNNLMQSGLLKEHRNSLQQIKAVFQHFQFNDTDAEKAADIFSLVLTLALVHKNMLDPNSYKLFPNMEALITKLTSTLTNARNLSDPSDKSDKNIRANAGRTESSPKRNLRPPSLPLPQTLVLLQVPKTKRMNAADTEYETDYYSDSASDDKKDVKIDKKALRSILKSEMTYKGDVEAVSWKMNVNSHDTIMTDDEASLEKLFSKVQPVGESMAHGQVLMSDSDSASDSEASSPGTKPAKSNNEAKPATLSGPDFEAGLSCRTLEAITTVVRASTTYIRLQHRVEHAAKSTGKKFSKLRRRAKHACVEMDSFMSSQMEELEKERSRINTAR
ncbi:hypothetical protein HDU99_010819 [Rhizoclosmatium hyalinum]|nr:hypothetical protein HDU99_010819 [Rhizoclosmatium hyalinum]